jgi:hypothetical protein
LDLEQAWEVCEDLQQQNIELEESINHGLCDANHFVVILITVVVIVIFRE